MAQQLNGIDSQMLSQIISAIEKRNTNKQVKPEQPNELKKPGEEKPSEPKPKPAKTIMVGEVSTRIWANQDQLGDITWRVDQRRTRSDGWGGPQCKTMRKDNLQDAIRGLYKASIWIKKTERRLRWRRLFL